MACTFDISVVGRHFENSRPNQIRLFSFAWNWDSERDRREALGKFLVTQPAINAQFLFLIHSSVAEKLKHQEPTNSQNSLVGTFHDEQFIFPFFPLFPLASLLSAHRENNNLQIGDDFVVLFEIEYIVALNCLCRRRASCKNSQAKKNKQKNNSRKIPPALRTCCFLCCLFVFSFFLKFG